MIRKRTLLATAAVWATLLGNTSVAQDPPAAVLTIEVEHETAYVVDTSDYSKMATDPNRTTPMPSGDATIRARTFSWVMVIADIVAVNGKPAKGTMLERAFVVRLTPDPTPGSTEAIADTTRFGLYDFNWEIQQADGTPIGSIHAEGVAGQSGAPPPGAIHAVQGGNVAIVGGTGAFLGARGYQGGTRGFQTTPFRRASVSEAPANRRIHGGGGGSHTLYLIPMFRPEIVTTRNGPAVFHASDQSLVTTAKPANPGEMLTLRATGLGPTRPGLELGKSFAADPPHLVNSPVGVAVNGTAGEVLHAGGYAGTTNTYQVSFRLPSGIKPGTASLQVTAAWVAGPEVKIPVQGPYVGR